MHETEFALVGGIYTCAGSAAVRSHPVHHGGFRALSAQFNRLLSSLDGNDDPYWAPLLRHLRRLRFELAALPIPFNAPEVELGRAQAAVETQYSEGALIYPTLAPEVRSILVAARELISSGDAPLLQRLIAIAEVTPPTDCAIVLCEARLVKAAGPLLRRYPILRQWSLLSAAQLRSLRCYSRLICIGSARWFPEYVTSAPRAVELDFVHFAWTPGPHAAPPLFGIPAPTVSNDERAEDSKHRAAGVVVIGDTASPDESEVGPFGPDEVLSISVVNQLVERANAAGAPGGQRQDLIRALPVGLEGRRTVFLDAEDGAKVLVLDLAERGKSRVRRMPTTDIEEGTFVLLRAGSGGDYVVPVADAVLGRRAAECREVQRDWKAKLRSEVERRGLFETSIVLLDHGAMVADEGNLRRWIWERSIRPRGYADFLAIMRLIGLESEAIRYWRVMKVIDGAHIRAGQLIRKMLIGQVMNSDLAQLDQLGTMEFDLPGTGTGRMIAWRILRVAREHVMISASHVGHPFIADEVLWQS